MDIYVHHLRLDSRKQPLPETTTQNAKTHLTGGSPVISFSNPMYGCVRLGNPDLDFEIRISYFAIERISPPRNPSSGWISIKKSNSGFHGFPFYRSIGNPQKDLQNCSSEQRSSFC